MDHRCGSMYPGRHTWFPNARPHFALSAIEPLPSSLTLISPGNSNSQYLRHLTGCSAKLCLRFIRCAGEVRHCLQVTRKRVKWESYRAVFARSYAVDTVFAVRQRPKTHRPCESLPYQGLVRNPVFSKMSTWRADGW